MKNSEREQEGLHSLGHKTEYKMDYAPEVLETFVNKHQGNDYWVRFNCPEFTSLCPITGQPDFAEIRISYIPDIKMVRAKVSSSTFSVSVTTVTFTKIASTRS